MKTVRRGFRGRFVLCICLVVVGLVPCSAKADDATFVNHTKDTLYVWTYGGFANKKCSGGPLIKKLIINPTNQATASVNNSDPFCYAAFRSNTTNVPAAYCALWVTAPITVTFDANTAGCTASIVGNAQVKLAIRKIPVSRPRTGGGGIVYVEDESRVHTILAKWTDPLTPPHTEARCTNMASGDWPTGGGWETCLGWELDCQWMEDELEVTVRAQLPTTVDDIKNALNDCVNDGMIAAAITTVVGAVAGGGGGAAVAQQTFEEVLYACLISRVANFAGVDVQVNSQWSAWRPCVSP